MKQEADLLLLLENFSFLFVHSQLKFYSTPSQSPI